MYFKDRAEAGRLLADKLSKFKNKQTFVVALSLGSVIVAAQVAMKLRAGMALLLTEGIYLPGELDALAGLSSAGTYTYNNMFSAGEIEEMVSEYNQYIEQQRIEKMHRMNMLLGHDGEISRDVLRRHIVITISDGLANGFSLDVAADFLDTVAIAKLVIAAPVASLEAVDRMHLLGDELCCLSTTDNYMFTNHYYDDNTIPDVEESRKIMRNIALNWSRD